jgi:transglutaminase-like putative cysteine protease
MQGRVVLQAMSTAALYGMAWLVSLLGILAFREARLELGTPLFFVLFATGGTLLSAAISRFAHREDIRLLFGFLDATLLLFTITAQPWFNALARMSTDPSIEIYLSTSLLWYLTLRTPLMVSLPSVLFQAVPVMALFGVIGSYLFAPTVPYLFVAFVVVLVAMLMFAYQQELQIHLPLQVIGRYAMVLAGASALLASGLAFVLWFTVGEVLSGWVIGLPMRPSQERSSPSASPTLPVGTGPVVLSNLELMRVRFLEGDSPYLRMEAYDLYTGRGWNRTRSRFQRIEANERGEFEFPPVHSVRYQRAVHAEIMVVGGIHQHFYSPGTPLWLKPYEPRRAVGYDAFAGSISVRRPIAPGHRYEIRALVPRQEPVLLRRHEAASPFWYAWSESARNARVFNLVRKLTRDKTNDYEKVLVLKRYIETNAAYNIETEAYPPDEDVVEYFLFVARQGDCTEFATALAVMCQYAGLPARVVRGYLVRERDLKTGEYIVRERDRHLWTEVYFENIGWVPFDATEGARVINAGRDPQNGSAGDSTGIGLLLRWRKWLDGLIVAVLVLLIASVLVARRAYQRAERSTRSARIYARLVWWLRLAGCPAPDAHESPAHYLERCATLLHSLAPRLAETLRSLQEPISCLLYAPESDARRIEAVVQGKIGEVWRAVWRDLGIVRLVGRAVRLKWRDFWRVVPPAPLWGEG